MATDVPAVIQLVVKAQRIGFQLTDAAVTAMLVHILHARTAHHAGLAHRKRGDVGGCHGVNDCLRQVGVFLEERELISRTGNRHVRTLIQIVGFAAAGNGSTVHAEFFTEIVFEAGQEGALYRFIAIGSRVP